MQLFRKKEVEFTPPLINPEEYNYLRLKVDFYEKSNRIMRIYQGDRERIMHTFTELLSRTLNYPVTLVIKHEQRKIFGSPFPYIEEYEENLSKIKPFVLVTSQNYPVMTLPYGYIVWHNPNYIFSLDEDFLYTVASQIALVEDNIRFVESLSKISITDPLTGLHNRRHLIDCLSKELSRSERHNTTFGFVIFDIDHFKSYNDTYGHQEGDEALILLAKVLQETLRQEDIKARYGGEEFCVVLPQCSQEYLFKVAEKIRLMVEYRLKPPITKRDITVSVGGSLYPEAQSIDELIKLADTRLYKAKHEGRNRVVVN